MIVCPCSQLHGLGLEIHQEVVVGVVRLLVVVVLLLVTTVRVSYTVLPRIVANL
jgi:hypothetical protein